MQQFTLTKLFMKTRIKNLLLLLLLLGLPGVVQAQDAYSTNADGSIYTYSTNADGSANIVAYAGPPWVVTIPANINGLTVTTIGDNAFEGCYNLWSVTIPNSVTSIGDLAFFECKSLTSVILPNSVTSIGGSAFYYCTSLTSVTLPNSVTSIGDYTFQGCASLTSVTLPNSVTSIGSEAFAECYGLTSVTIENGVTSIGDYAFFECTSLTSVTIPNSVTTIGTNAFALCFRLTSVTIPASVTSIGMAAFAGCYRLTEVYFQGNAPSPTNDSTVFSDNLIYPNDPATVYYLPGTTGWGAMFDGRPAVLWNLQAKTFSFTGGQFGFNLTGPANVVIVVEACTNLSHPVWLAVSTNALSGLGTSAFSDPQSGGYPMRYYRFRSP
jgi:hypothetical protein